MKYLLDTNILSEPIKKIPDTKVMKFLEKEDGNFCICAPVLHEIEYGIELLEASRRKLIFQEYLEEIRFSLDILPYDAESARLHSVERARLAKLGKIIPFADGQIASITLRNHLILVTKNKKDYENFKSLKIIEF